ncbi:hypothetical protein [Halorubrum sp. DTA46]|uniref:hypothetical protein n=1 Tax=Halorubrum sp. DTA46 TaxID=3402162 RepID=UPI003AB07D7F
MSDIGPAERPHDEAIEAAVDQSDDADREDLLKRAIVALAETEDIDVPDAEEVAAIRADLNELDADLDEKVSDLRERFVELYRDLEAKAPADHTHEATDSRLDAVASDVDNLAAEIDAVAERVDETRDDVGDRLARVESRTEELDALESRVTELDSGELDDKLSRVASAVVRVRRRLEAAERDRADRERLDALTAAANRAGVRKAKCTDCGETVNLGLLTTPECPHCGRRFAELEPNPGFLGTSKLITEEPPALDGDVDANENRAGDDSRGVTARDDTADRGGT